jgi:hypothetical protein
MSFLILEMGDSGDWAPRLGARQIPERRRPTMLQPSREVADQEAVRLAREHPGRRFVVFAPVVQGVTVKVPTHVTLAGRVVAERDQALLVAINDPDEFDDELPF